MTTPPPDSAPLDVARLRLAYERATPGEWRFDHDWHRCPMISGSGKDIVYIQKIGSPEQDGNAAFIVAAHENWNALLTEITTLRAEKAEAEARGIELDDIKASMAYRHSLIGRTQARVNELEAQVATLQRSMSVCADSPESLCAKAAAFEQAACVCDEEVENRRADQKRDPLDNFIRGQLNAALRLAEYIRALTPSIDPAREGMKS